MKLEITNENYSATVVSVNNLVDIGLNTLLAFPIFGLQALVPKTTKIGDKLLLFPAEVKLSREYCKNNNLFRKPELNSDINSKGYIEENRRIKAIKLGGQYSTALAMPISSLKYLNIDDLKEGDRFNSINGVEICKKYEIITKQTRERGNNIRGLNKKFKRVETKLFPEHLDTENYLRNQDKIRDNEYIYVSQKLHGSSGRFGHILINRELSWFEKILKKFNVNIPTTEYGYVAGSRRTVKDVLNENQNHYYSSDIWNNMLDRYKTQIPKNYIIYGEIVGYTPENSMIQKGYTYGQESKTSELYVYRVVFMNEDGIGVDLSFPQMKEWCNKNGFKHVAELWRGEHILFKNSLDVFTEVNFSDEVRKFIKEGNTGHYWIDDPIDNGVEYPEEGVCIRVDGITPYILKMKNQSFLLQETKQLDSGEPDIETEN